MKVIGIKADSLAHADWIVETLKTAVNAKRVTLEDIAVVSRDEKGKVKLEQTKDTSPGKGARRGTLVGALVGLAAPPLLGAAAIGAGVGAVWGRFRDRGIDDDLMRRVGDMIADGEAVVFALGADASIDAIAERVREISGGTMETFLFSEGDEALLREAAVEIDTPTSVMTKLPLS